MSERSSEELSLSNDLLELKAMLSKRLADPLPESYDERLSLLEKHLLEVTAVLEKYPSSTFITISEQVAQSINFARQISADIRGMLQIRSELSDCDSAAVTGVALITLGALGGGPVGAIAGFGYGVALLAASC
jgi:hypothetical protein